MRPENKRLISKAAGSTNAREKALTTTLKVYHLLPQSLNACINGINSRLNLLHKEGPGNPTKVLKNELHNKARANKLLCRSPPLQDTFGGNSVNKVLLDVVHHAPQQLQKVLLSGTAKVESLHKVTAVAIDYL